MTTQKLKFIETSNINIFLPRNEIIPCSQKPFMNYEMPNTVGTY